MQTREKYNAVRLHSAEDNAVGTVKTRLHYVIWAERGSLVKRKVGLAIKQVNAFLDGVPGLLYLTHTKNGSSGKVDGLQMTVSKCLLGSIRLVKTIALRRLICQSVKVVLTGKQTTFIILMPRLVLKCTKVIILWSYMPNSGRFY